ncbi:NAD binding NADP oxidoreductase coenzyme F420-dependent, putative [Metarhizium acridum CQMa 102]|uniref:NAD binding NADP oxidoreductase coenzyme F420-dependent, putative n=1 Tax=Metarhizium acridum (strain CQMa 102) TaxID=655827 RepID=E9EH07_METAQ|nr:NAD binding NADP oxidoreductase coenzyme F420-dependent, putative [Metarhizium acridum CQMa 102]EFY84792.1 NAD binding NADP oxidoreductase coenzyme F420-dependent, putative [Metarhizium acridum CQMa 102]
MRIGFLGLGRMGTPMALNLCKNYPTTVWNRTASKYPTLADAGARIGDTPAQVAKQSDLVFTMLFDAPAIQSIFDDSFKRAIRNKTIVNTSSVPVEFSQKLERQILSAGGSYIEMPVSGSKVPAEQGKLVGMMAGDKAVCERVRPYVQPLTSASVYCGPIGSGLKMKYAINAYLITVTAGLAEAMSLAQAQGLDLDAFSKVLAAGPLASAYSKLKVDKVLAQDWSAQAAIEDCYNSTQLIQAAATEAETKSPLVRLCGELYSQARASGMAEDDMIAVFKLLARSTTTST